MLYFIAKIQKCVCKNQKLAEVFLSFSERFPTLLHLQFHLIF